METIGLELLSALFPKDNNAIASVSLLLLGFLLIVVILFIISFFILNHKKIIHDIYYSYFYWMPKPAYTALLFLVSILSLGLYLKWTTPRNIFDAFIGAFVALYLESLLQKNK